MKLARINTILLVVIVLINGYIIVWPFVPGLLFGTHTSPARIKQLTRIIHARAPTVNDKASQAPTPNQLIMPSIGFDEQIYDGPTTTTLNKGLWRLPLGSTPDKESNTVIAGHRFTYTNPRGVLYNLDKIHIGDEIGVIWSGRTYLYRVATVKEVPPTDTTVEAPTIFAQITIYTCTPLWLPKNRLVVVATTEDIL